MRIWRDVGDAVTAGVTSSRHRDERGIRIWWNVIGAPNRYLRQRQSRRLAVGHAHGRSWATR